ncbi:endonuclease/exonuclease/phosphatase family protein [Sphingomonas kyeonggiensis]|uniref:Endonuclease/exonuclease/phosphatase family metal-dependent hydrolase n=1 Tax=Sphingomonas kyeonggiensis TaxID=1268553 RepID=A0A7W6NZ26_9SPHN|nr:endonuclease/exonuclease/phosphatase family protein [Sphingomonas kyeonggiensis]MBB4100943.1 endonuclease/exonuclease/phosphatase family metal-dependent hydrolase [Sphingomonas kyeonggiensis]
MIRFLWLVLALLAPVAAQAQDKLVVMSFNVRYPSPNDGANVWEKRRDLFVETVAAAAPDVVGTQELFQLQGDYLVAKLPQYSWFGVDRRGDHADEHMGVFYRRDRLKLVEQGNFWLSDAPDTVASISWGNIFPRMVTWGLFETRAGKRFYLLNTHFPYRAEDEAAREKCAELLRRRIAALPKDVPVVLTGDFNIGPEAKPHALLSQDLADVRSAVHKPEGPEATFHGFKGAPDRRIDWILARGFRPLAFRTIDAHRGELYPSDHYPVVATLAWTKRR